MLRTLLFGLFLCMVTYAPVFAQVNLKIGYDFCLTDPAPLNELFQRFNDQPDVDWDRTLKDLRLLHGAELGVRMRWDWFGLELGWETRLAERRAEGTQPGQQQVVSKALNISYNTFSAGAAFYVDRVGVGGTLDAATFVVRAGTLQSDTKPRVVREPLLTSQVFLAYEVPTGGSSAISFRPYVQVPWSQIDLSGLERDLFPDDPAPVDPVAWSPLTFGLKIVFLNGPQSN